MSVRRGVSAKVLDCGCLTGVYETYAGQMIQIVDVVGAACSRHRKGDEIDRDGGGPIAAPGRPVDKS